jgi:ubiquinone/menaquinone biosynthesis C-methylase UbiE
MRPIRDPEGEEIKHLLAACELRGKSVLEIGCGDGFFTRQYAHMAKSAVGIDPDSAKFPPVRNKARAYRMVFIQAEGESLPFSPGIFDIAIFACSL